MKQKVLVLSLGVGSENTEENNNYPYKTANYRFEGKEYPESPFVADALINTVKPDHILIIGTVKSAWGAFYHKFHKASVNDFEIKWENLESKISRLNKDSSDNEIKEFQDEINQLYLEEIALEDNPSIEVCIIKYGLTQDELNNNYKRISNVIKECIDKVDLNSNIEISFDITHSFRSLPIYNLVVIDYCRLLLMRNIKVSHVFYGNLDVSKETDGKAEIVDLKDIVNVFETTRGISEFIDTGNATTLLKDIDPNEDNKDPFIQWLKEFNEAIQMNDRNKIQVALENMLKADLTGDKNALLDAKVSIREIIGKNIQHIGTEGDTPLEQQVSKSKFQIDLASWCLRQGQVGMAAAIAKEGFRSFLVSIFEPNKDNYEEEDFRKRAEQCFEKTVSKTKGVSEFKKYKRIERLARDIRNTYAHNLDKSARSEFNYSNARDIIKRYINVIKSIMNLSTDKINPPKSAASINKNEHITVFISNISDENDIEKCYKKLFSKQKNIRIAVLKGRSFELPNKGKNDRIKSFSREIALVIRNLMYSFEPGTITRIVWGPDIYKALYDNATMLIRSCNPEAAIAFLRLTDTFQMEIIQNEYLWKINTDEEFNEKQIIKIQSATDKYQIEYIQKDNVVDEDIDEDMVCNNDV